MSVTLHKNIAILLDHPTDSGAPRRQVVFDFDTSSNCYLWKDHRESRLTFDGREFGTLQVEDADIIFEAFKAYKLALAEGK